MPWLLTIFVIGATFRLTRLVTTDYLFAGFRRVVARRFGDDGLLAYLVECDACSSVWIAPAVVTPAILWPTNRAVLAVLAALTASGVTILVRGWEDEA